MSFGFTLPPLVCRSRPSLARRAETNEAELA
jgi:hypothetical protein